jgi:uncharacterized protein YcbX
MAGSQGAVAGRVAAVWRYPVKSMPGEELAAAEVTERGLLGDRAYALVDAPTGKVASAKNPRLWPRLFDFRAAYAEPPGEARPLPAVRLTFPDGTTLTSDQPDLEPRLAAALGRAVRLARSAPAAATAEGYWPDHDWLAQRDVVFDFPLPPGTFFDAAVVHLVTTATLDRLRLLSRGGSTSSAGVPGGRRLSERVAARDAPALGLARTRGPAAAGDAQFQRAVQRHPVNATLATRNQPGFS